MNPLRAAGWSAGVGAAPLCSDDAAPGVPKTFSSRLASRRAASNSSRMRGDVAPDIVPSVSLIVSAIVVSERRPRA